MWPMEAQGQRSEAWTGGGKQPHTGGCYKATFFMVNASGTPGHLAGTLQGVATSEEWANGSLG